MTLVPLLLASLSFAEAPVPLSLEDALRRAQEASEDVDAAEASVDRARGSSMSAVSGLLPQVSASTSYQHTFVSEYDALFEGTDPGTPSPFSSLPFGQDDIWRVDFALTQALWSGGRNRASMRMADAAREAATLSVDAARASTALATAQAYYDAALADRLVDIAATALAQAETTRAHAKLAHELGRQPEFELVRAEVEAENQRVVVLRQERIRTFARLRLARLLDLPAEAELALVTPLDEEPSIAETAAEVTGVRATDTDRAAVKQAAEAVRMSEAALAVTRSQGYPRLAASANYGWVDYPDGPVPDVEPDAWRNNFTAGLGLSVPLFTGGRVRGELVSAKADVAEANARLSQVGELAALDTADARAALETADAQWRATAGTVAQAERAYAIAEVRFQEGISTQSELADARLLLQRALANRAQAARDLQVSRVRLALLPALPLSSGAPPS